MATQVTPRLQRPTDGATQKAMLLGLLPIYPKRAVLIYMLDGRSGKVASPDKVLATAAYLHEKELILLDANTDFQNPGNLVGRLTAAGFDTAVELVNEAIDRQKNPPSPSPPPSPSAPPIKVTFIPAEVFLFTPVDYATPGASED